MAGIALSALARFHDELAAISCVEPVFPLPCGLHWPNPGPEWCLGPAEASAGHLAVLGAMFGREFT